MIQGEELAFDLESIKVADTDFVCLHIVGPLHKSGAAGKPTRTATKWPPPLNGWPSD